MRRRFEAGIGFYCRIEGVRALATWNAWMIAQVENRSGSVEIFDHQVDQRLSGAGGGGESNSRRQAAASRQDRDLGVSSGLQTCGKTGRVEHSHDDCVR